MDRDRLEQEVDQNYDCFLATLPSLLPKREGEWVLMREGEMIGFYGTSSAALVAGRLQYQDGIYSVQEVTGRPVDLGFFSHAIASRIA